jgi:hypothetical protein
MPDLAFSSTNSVGAGWTVQKLSNNPAGFNLGYTVTAPAGNQDKEDK